MNKIFRLFALIIFSSLLCPLDLSADQIIPSKPYARLGKGYFVRGGGDGLIAYSPDGKLLAVASSIGVWLYDANSLAEVGLLEDTYPIDSIAFSPDGKMLVSGNRYDNAVRLWDVAIRKEIAVLRGHTSGVTSVAFSPDGRILASGSWDSTVRLWDVAKRKQTTVLNGHTNGVYSVTFSPDGQTLASGGWDQTVRLWDVATRKRIAILGGHTGTVHSVAFTTDGKLLASAGGWKENTIRLWNVATKEQIVALDGNTGGIECIAFSPDNQLLAAGNGDNTVRLWNVATKEQIAVLEHTDDVASVAFNPDNQTLASGSYDNRIHLWDVATGEQINVLERTGHTGSVYSVSFSPDGRMIASGSEDTTVRLWNPETKEQIVVLKGHTDEVNSVAFSPDGQTLASSGHTPPEDKNTRNYKGEVRLWNTATNDLIAVLKHSSPVYSVAFSLDGQMLAMGSDDGVFLWNVKTKKQTIVNDALTLSVAFSRDGEMLAAGGETVRLWNAATGKRIGALENGLGADITFSPDGKMLALVGGAPTSGVFYWEVPDGNLRRTNAKGAWHSNVVNSVEFSPGGEIFASGGQDRTVRLWDAVTKEIVAILEYSTAVYSVDFSPGGGTLAAGIGNGTVLLWNMGPYHVKPKGKRVLTWGKLKRTALLPNYPNPFNPDTWIPFVLAEESEVSLRICDVKGNIVRTISLGKRPAGEYTQKPKSIYWDGKNNSGERVASGVYFYSLQAGEYASTRRMAIAK